MADTVKVKEMRNTVGYQGRLYGPGKDIEVPRSLAEGMGFEKSDLVADKEPPTGPLRGTAEELDLQYSKAELEEEAARRGLTVTRTDGKSGDARKEDLVAALAD